MTSQIKVGCCGFAEGRRKYFQQFKLVEVQQTFYKLPSFGTVSKWREEAPQDFEFSIKAWQAITHLPSSPTYRKASLQIPAGREANYGFFKPSEEVFNAWEKTEEIARVLKAKVIVFQCPTRFGPTAENIGNMKHFFTNISRDGFIFVWEPRGEWSNDIIMALCRDLDLTHCVNPLEREAAYGKLKYFRLHGGRNYRHKYSNDELARLWELSLTLPYPLNREENSEVYVLFNNLTMYDDALRFKALIRR